MLYCSDSSVHTFRMRSSQLAPGADATAYSAGARVCPDITLPCGVLPMRPMLASAVTLASALWHGGGSAAGCRQAARAATHSCPVPSAASSAGIRPCQPIASTTSARAAARSSGSRRPVSAGSGWALPPRSWSATAQRSSCDSVCRSTTAPCSCAKRIRAAMEACSCAAHSCSRSVKSACPSKRDAHGPTRLLSARARSASLIAAL